MGWPLVEHGLQAELEQRANRSDVGRRPLGRPRPGDLEEDARVDADAIVARDRVAALSLPPVT